MHSEEVNLPRFCPHHLERQGKTCSASTLNAWAASSLPRYDLISPPLVCHRSFYTGKASGRRGPPTTQAVNPASFTLNPPSSLLGVPIEASSWLPTAQPQPFNTASITSKPHQHCSALPGQVNTAALSSHPPWMTGAYLPIITAWPCPGTPLAD